MTKTKPYPVPPSEYALNEGVTKVREDYPEEGTYAAVVEDVLDLGRRRTPWGGKYFVQIVFLVTHKDGEGFYRMRVNYNPSLHEKANLRKAVDVISPTLTDNKNVDLVDIIGCAVNAVVTLRTNKKGNRYASIAALLSIRPMPFFAPVHKQSEARA